MSSAYNIPLHTILAVQSDVNGILKPIDAKNRGQKIYRTSQGLRDERESGRGRTYFCRGPTRSSYVTLKSTGEFGEGRA
jgi:hypothetical protein